MKKLGKSAYQMSRDLARVTPHPVKCWISLTKPLADLGTLHSVGLPIHVYPLYENAFRAHRNQSIAANDAESARLYADFAKVAESNPMSWNYGEKAKTESEIGTVGKRNRMICFPCKPPRSSLIISQGI
jgi:hypothetical protein